MVPGALVWDVALSRKCGQPAALFRLEPDCQVFGAVGERRLEKVGNGALPIVGARFHDLTGAGQLGAVREVCQDVTVNATGAAQLKTPAVRPCEVSANGVTPEAHVGPVEKPVTL